ncbi:MAG TPA: ankyrin repeat domain-containing protein [Albitalea sp.]|uniref:ankyrin repeat domain-containing protein n=1 Tax=Piscinibacter sp. TaxID=1903157 RepID=UPI002ED28772
MNFGSLYIRLQPSLLSAENRKQLGQRFRHGSPASAPVENALPERSTWQCVRLFECGTLRGATKRLNRAACEGDDRAARHYLKIVRDPNESSEADKPPPLVNATTGGFASIVRRLLQDPRTDPNQPHPVTGKTALAAAVANGDADLVSEFLADRRTDPNLPNARTGRTPLATAAAMGEDELVRALLAARTGRLAFPDVPDSGGHTPLTLAAKHLHLDVIRLMTQDPTVDVDRRVDGEPVLVSVVKATQDPDGAPKRARAIEYLRMAGAKVNEADDNGHTALDIAIANNDAAAVCALCAPMDDLLARHEGEGSRAFGSVVDLSRIRMPLAEAAAAGQVQMLDALLQHPGVTPKFIDEALCLLDDGSPGPDDLTPDDRLESALRGRRWNEVRARLTLAPPELKATWRQRLATAFVQALEHERWADAVELTGLASMEVCARALAHLEPEARVRAVKLMAVEASNTPADDDPAKIAAAWQAPLQHIADSRGELTFDEFNRLVDTVEQAARENVGERHPRFYVALAYVDGRLRTSCSRVSPHEDTPRAWFQTLGVWPDTTTRTEINKIYKKLALRCHPDKNDPDTTKQFQLLSHAYDRARIERNDLFL